MTQDAPETKPRRLHLRNKDATPEEITSYKKLFFILLMAITIGVILTTQVPHITPESAKAQLDAFAATIAAEAKDSGMEASFTHGDITIAGFGYNKQAVIASPALNVTQTTWLGPNTVTLSTPRMYLIPSAIGNVFHAVFPDPLTVSRNGAPQRTLSFSGGQPAYTLVEQRYNDVSEFVHTVFLPPHMTIASGPAGSEQKTEITYNERPQVAFKRAPAQKRSEITLGFQNILIREGERQITIGSASLGVMRKPNEDGKIAFDSVTLLSDIGVKTMQGLEGPYSFKLSTAGTRSAVPTPPMAPQDSDLTVRELVLTADKFQLQATGQISRKPDDSLPFGLLDVQVKNFSSLRNSPTLAPEIKAAIVDIASRVSGVDAASAEDMQFTVKRDKLGPLAIGTASFEDVAAIFFSRVMLGGQTPPSAIVPPSAPAAGGEPGAQPAEPPAAPESAPST